MGSKKDSINSGKKNSNPKEKPVGKPIIKSDFLDKLDTFFQKRLNFFFWTGIILTSVFTLLLFDVKVGPGGDDSAYISRAYDFLKEFKYPTFQGALYPIVLSPFIAIFGINLTILKFLSTIFLIVASIYFFKAFKNRIPSSLLVIAFLLASYNYYMLYFGSQTYSEAFFMMLQALFFYFTVKYFTTENFIPGRKEYLITGLILFLMCLTKNVAYASLMAIVGYFILSGKWKSILYILISFFIFFVPWEILKRVIWKADDIQFQSQGNLLMYKDFYNQSRGKEDFFGLIQRVIDNSHLYISKHFYKFIGFRSDAATDILPLLTVLTFGLFLVGIYFVFKKNKPLLFTSVYVLCMLLISFVSLQKHWDQWRLIIIYLPFMLLLVFSALYYSFKTVQLNSLQFIIPLLALIMLITSLRVTTDYVKIQKEVLARNLDGDLLFGFTPDWQNYMLMSEWAAKNTPAEYMIACRKSDISFIYGGRKFYGIIKVPTSDIDSIISNNNRDSLVYTIFHLKKLIQGNQRPDLQYRQYLQGIVSGEFSFGDTITDNSNFVAIYALPANKLQEMRNDPSIKGIVAEELNAKEWVEKKLKEDAEISIVKPDYLYDLFKKTKVKYAILASLRLNPNENTGNIISTLHRYLYFIQLKYPEAFKEIHTIGTEETSTLIEIKLD